MSVSNINSGIHTGVTQTHEKCAMKMKERTKMTAALKFFDDRKDFVWPFSEVRHDHVDELQVNNSSHTEGTSYLSSKQLNGHQKDGFRA